MLGKVLPPVVTGAMLLVMGCLTLTKQVKMGKFTEAAAQSKQAASERIGTKIFIPAVTVGVIALVLSFVKYDAVNAEELSPYSAEWRNYDRCSLCTCLDFGICHL